jgi:hypothetical protein
MIGSIYGMGVYSAGLYSWYAVWVPIGWHGAGCEQVVTVRESYYAPPVVNWTQIECQPVTGRR